MRILGIDPGLRLTGYGVIDWHPLKPKLVDGGVIRLREKEDVAHRLVELERDLDALFAEYKPEVCAVEQLYAHYAHPRTAILMGHARGVILLVAARRGARIEQFAANRIKQSLTGHGHASKEQMQKAVQGLWNLDKPPDPPDPMRRPGVGPRKTVAPLSQEGAERLFALINGSSPDGG